MESIYCYRCGAEIVLPIYRSSECPGCGSDARVCKNCTFYAPGRQHDCKEHIVDPVHEKERANFCDYFRPTEQAFHPDTKEKKRKEESRRAFDDLFS